MRKIKKPFDPSETCGITFTAGTSKTQQQFKNENDPYRVIDRHTRGLPNTLKSGGIYADVSEINQFTHDDKINKLKNTLDEQNAKMQKLQKEQKELYDNEQFVQFEKRRNNKNSNHENNEPNDKKDLQK